MSFFKNFFFSFFPFFSFFKESKVTECFIYWFTSQMFVAAGADLGQSQELHLVCHLGARGSRAWSVFTCFPSTIAGSY